MPSAGADDDPWATAQQRGGWWGALPAGEGARAPAPAQAQRVVRYQEPQLDGDPAAFPLRLLPYLSATLLDGSLAHLPWLQELPDPLTSAMWSTWVEINPRTAERLGIGDRDVVEVTSQHGSVRAGAILSPGIAPDLVGIPVGQGHRTFTRFASGRGDNVLAILAPVVEPETGMLAWASTRVRVSRAGAPDGRLILFAGAMREDDRGERAR
jgi:anaerobic selenocysteine-containing dehydrogenase